MTTTQHRIIGATIRATNRTHGLAPSRPAGEPEVVTEVVNAYDMTVATDRGNVYANGDYTIVRDAEQAANAIEVRVHAFGRLRGHCIFCGVHRDAPAAAEPCTASTTGTIITL